MSHEHTARPATVMVVENDPATRLTLCLAIEAHPALQLVAAPGTVAAALAWLARRQVNLLVTELRLPDGSGLEVIRGCARLCPMTDIMVLTNDSDERSVFACIEAGASGYVLKNAAQFDLAQALFELRAGGSPISPSIARMVLTCARNGSKARALPAAAAAGATALSRREVTILELIARGYSYNEVARQLTLSVGTIQSHIKHVYGKLSVHSRSAAVFEAQRRGFLPLSGQAISAARSMAQETAP